MLFVQVVGGNHAGLGCLWADWRLDGLCQRVYDLVDLSAHIKDVPNAARMSSRMRPAGAASAAAASDSNAAASTRPVPMDAKQRLFRSLSPARAFILATTSAHRAAASRRRADPANVPSGACVGGSTMEMQRRGSEPAVDGVL